MIFIVILVIMKLEIRNRVYKFYGIVRSLIKYDLLLSLRIIVEVIMEVDLKKFKLV